MKKDQSIKKLEAEIKRLKRLVYRDELTGLFNRWGFKEETNKFLKEIAREQEGTKRKVILNSFSVILIDLDHFKKVNDVYGHDAGDAALRHVSRIISGRVRGIDVVGRWGGEEVAVGLVGADEGDAFSVAETIRERVEQTPLIWKKKKISITLSAGVAKFGAEADVEELLAKADKALYAAKRSGRNRVVKFSEV